MEMRYFNLICMYLVCFMHIYFIDPEDYNLKIKITSKMSLEFSAVKSFIFTDIKKRIFSSLLV